MPTLVADLITEDPTNNEFVLYLVESSPWPDPLKPLLRELQSRLYHSVDAEVDGHLAAKYPDSKGRDVRIQVDAYDSVPTQVLDFVRKFASHLETNAEYRRSISNSPFVRSLRVVNGMDMGRQ